MCQLAFNYRHPHIPRGQEGELLLRAFHRDLAVNGPSLVRIVRTMLRGWKRYQDHPNPRIRARFAHEASRLSSDYARVLWAAQRYYQDDPHLAQLISQIQDELYAEFGAVARSAAARIGRFLYATLRRETRRLRHGATYEPPTFYETNSAEGPAGAVRVAGLSVPAGRNSAEQIAARQ